MSIEFRPLSFKGVNIELCNSDEFAHLTAPSLDGKDELYIKMFVRSRTFKQHQKWAILLQKYYQKLGRYERLHNLLGLGLLIYFWRGFKLLMLRSSARLLRLISLL